MCAQFSRFPELIDIHSNDTSIKVFQISMQKLAISFPWEATQVINVCFYSYSCCRQAEESR